jgi:membrane-bound ClpP family serine protease
MEVTRMLFLRDRYSRMAVGILCLLLAAHSFLIRHTTGVTLIEIVAGLVLLALAAFASRPHEEAGR